MCSLFTLVMLRMVPSAWLSRNLLEIYILILPSFVHVTFPSPVRKCPPVGPAPTDGRAREASSNAGKPGKQLVGNSYVFLPKCHVGKK